MSVLLVLAAAVESVRQAMVAREREEGVKRNSAFPRLRNGGRYFWPPFLPSRSIKGNVSSLTLPFLRSCHYRWGDYTGAVVRGLQDCRRSHDYQ